jgi:ribosome maturation factor RimP
VFNDGKGDQVLDFALDEVREARLVPVVDFKGRRASRRPRRGRPDKRLTEVSDR